MHATVLEESARTRTLFARPLVMLVAATALAAAAGCRTPEGTTPAERRDHIVRESSKILEAVYAAQPTAREKVAESAGYGTFSNIEFKLMLAGSGNGYGLAVDRKTNQRTFMRLNKLQVGFGAGVQEFRMLVVFKDRAKFEKFVDGGWQFGGGADASLQHREKESGVDTGVQASAEMDPLVYQVTEAGVNLSATVDGIRYRVDKELN